MRKLLAFWLVLTMFFSVAVVFTGCEDTQKKKRPSSEYDDEEEDSSDEDEKDDEGSGESSTENLATEVEPTVGETTPVDPEIYEEASVMAQNRLMELVNLYSALRKNSVSVSQTDMEAAIATADLSTDYKTAVSNVPSQVINDSLLQDYRNFLNEFWEEINNDFLMAQSSFQDAPYQDHEEFEDPIFCFMFLEGMVSVEYGVQANGKKDFNVIENMAPMYPSTIKDQESAIEYVYTYFISARLDMVLLFSATSAEIINAYTDCAVQILLSK